MGLRDKLPSRPSMPSIDRNNVTKPKEWMNKKDNSYSKAQSHQSAPLSSLRDPSQFAPPPKHINYHGADAARASVSNPASPAVSTPGSATAPSNALVPSGNSSAVDTRKYDTDRGGWGGALSQDSVSSWQQQKQLEQEEAEKPKVPTGPYRKDTTGLRTDHLPPPPVRRGTGVASPPSSAVSRTPTGGSRPPLPPPSANASPAKPKPPGLPPRLPPRQSTEPNEYTPPPPPSYNEATSQPQTPAETQAQPPFPTPSNLSTNAGTLNRLAGAGVSVPGLGVSRNAAPPAPQPASPSSRFNQGGGLSELQSRFKGLNTATNSSAPSQPQQSTSPQAPITANSVGSAYSTFVKARQDPSKVSFSETKQAASTANAVNQRYGAQIGQGLSAANKFAGNNGLNGQSNGAGASGSESGGGFGGVAALAGAAQKKAPPPPPPSRSSVNAGQGAAAPPPVPMGSKPRF
ncbi:Hypothetical protein D9617_16g014330 [Elsinoe fawcettii]|nr:Hypothetical protein D9617_16g014330 [Elsinoe fawcettii]